MGVCVTINRMQNDKSVDTALFSKLSGDRITGRLLKIEGSI